jgi:DNA topoisomerase-3
MRLFIAEKPSVAKALAAELGGATRAEGHLACGSDAVTWCFGHMLEMAMPEDYAAEWKAWRLEVLPLRPSSWKLLPRRDAKKQLAEIGKLLKKASAVVHAGDPDREGQLLVDEVLEHFRYSGPVQRFWVSAQDSTSIQRGLKALRDNREYRGLRDAALGRGRADWLVGLNMTRAYTLRAQAADAGAGVRTVGRVQTPTVALVVERDRAIASFRPVPFFSVVVELEHAAGHFQAKWAPAEGQAGLDAEGRVVDAAVASAVVAKALGQAGVLVGHEEETRSEGQPKTFTLTRLTLEASNRWGYSADDVLQACQALYETHKLASYPRTDCAYLPESQHADAPKVLAALKQVIPDLAAVIAGANAQLKSSTWDDRKVTAHHGIIPTMHVGDASKLSEMERNVYELVVRSYVAQFYPAHKFLQTKVTAEVTGEHFTATGKVVTEAGWGAVYAEQEAEGSDEARPQSLPPMKKGDAVRCTNAERKDLRTKPPARFTEGTLVIAMENIHKVVADAEEKRVLKEEDGIGTVATRPMIISELKRRAFLRRSGKHLVSTEEGQKLVDGLPAELKSASMTAVYERALKDIAEGRGDLDAFLKRVEGFVGLQVSAVKKGTAAAPSVKREEIECPVCHKGSLRRIPRKSAGKKGAKSHFWGCSRYSEGCKGAFNDVDGEPDLEGASRQTAEGGASEIECPSCHEGRLRRIERKDKTGHFWGCSRFKEGCKATFKDNAGKPVLEAPPPTSASAAKAGQGGAAGIECPACRKGHLQRIQRKDKSGHFWGCSGFREGCTAKFADKAGAPVLPKA